MILDSKFIVVVLLLITKIAAICSSGSQCTQRLESEAMQMELIIDRTDEESEMAKL